MKPSLYFVIQNKMYKHEGSIGIETLNLNYPHNIIN
jgi:hypothetical protein